MPSEPEFITVTHKKRRRKKLAMPKANGSSTASTCHSSNCSLNRKQSILSQLKSYQEEILSKTNLPEMIESLSANAESSTTKIIQIICYGVGHISESVSSRYQLALVLALCRRLSVDSHQVLFYDPIFSNCDTEILSDLNFGFIAMNEEGKRRVSSRCGRTLFFMPHCGRPLYNNLLWKNWNPSDLKKLLVLGNSFSNIRLNTPSRVLASKAKYLQDCERLVTELPLNPGELYDVLNDFALHSFETNECHVNWFDVSEPTYDSDEDVEFIRKVS